jgi:hypothetical protein
MRKGVAIANVLGIQHLIKAIGANRLIRGENPSHWDRLAAFEDLESLTTDKVDVQDLHSGDPGRRRAFLSKVHQERLQDRKLAFSAELDNTPLIEDPTGNALTLCQPKNEGAKAHTLDSPLDSNLPGYLFCRL